MNVEYIGIGILALALFYIPFHFSFLSREARKSVWQANLAMFCGFFGFLIVPGLLAIPLGHMARRRIKRAGGRLSGRGRATVGLVAGYLVVVGIAWMANSIRITAAHLDSIDRAKSAWAAATGATNGTVVTREELMPFMPGKVFPTPVVHEIYNINPIGVKASSHGDY